jgi:hypothetical protein
MGKSRRLFINLYRSLACKIILLKPIKNPIFHKQPSET